MSDKLYALAEVLINHNRKPCIHYNKLFMPLYLTCNTFYNKYFSEKLELSDCDNCPFKEINGYVHLLNYLALHPISWDYDIDEINASQSNIENIFQHKTEEIVIKNIKTPNFKSTKTKNIKNNYKHNGQQLRKQNQLKQPR